MPSLVRWVRAFTLVELVIGLAIVALLAALATPSFARYLAEQKLLSEARRLADGMTLARSEAIKRNGHVILCATSAADPCGGALHWHEGWVMFADADGNAQLDAGDQLLGREGSAEAGVTIVGNRPVEHYLRFDYLGRARLVSGALQMGTIVVCRPGLQGYHVVLANSGRTRIVRNPATCS